MIGIDEILIVVARGRLHGSRWQSNAGASAEELNQHRDFQI